MADKSIVHAGEIRDVLGEKTLVVSTGSRVIGGWDKNSDYDYVVFTGRDDIGTSLTKINSRYPIIRETPSGNYNDPNYQSVKYTDERRDTINLIICHTEDEFNKWLFATNMALKIPAEKLQRKDIRCAIFEKLKEIYTYFECKAPCKEKEESEDDMPF